MSCRNYYKVYVTNLKFSLTGPYNFLLHMYTLCYYNTNIIYNITMNNVQISVAKGDISLHGAYVGHSPFRIKLNFVEILLYLSLLHPNIQVGQ